ncbi:hypothetical protein [Novipirellula aureliae]|nr:hypothetical protein [Novipirellula aureliae]
MLLGIAVFSAVCPLMGCRICADCEDLAYPAYGGAWQRTNRESGRVASIFDPGGAKNPQLVSRDTPMVPDEIERARRSQDDIDIADDPEPMFEDFESHEDDSVGEDPQLPNPDNEDQQNREEELRNLNLEDIRVLPAKPMPPLT